MPDRVTYGVVKGPVASPPWLKPRPGPGETQYHAHFSLGVDGAPCDVAVNVGTDDRNDLLKFKIIQNFTHPLLDLVRAQEGDSRALSGSAALPALDYVRSDLLKGTGAWQLSEIMDGSETREPYATLKGLIAEAQKSGDRLFAFGRFYPDGPKGVHDIHMNQGSRGRHYRNAPDNPNGDVNQVWQDGALIIDRKAGGAVLFIAAFQKQLVPTDASGYPVWGGRSIEA